MSLDRRKLHVHFIVLYFVYSLYNGMI